MVWVWHQMKSMNVIFELVRRGELRKVVIEVIFLQNMVEA